MLRVERETRPQTFDLRDPRIAGRPVGKRMDRRLAIEDHATKIGEREDLDLIHAHLSSSPAAFGFSSFGETFSMKSAAMSAIDPVSFAAPRS